MSGGPATIDTAPILFGELGEHFYVAPRSDCLNRQIYDRVKVAGHQVHILFEHDNAIQVALAGVLHNGSAVTEKVIALGHQLFDDVATPNVIMAAELPAFDPDVGQKEVRRRKLGAKTGVHSAH